MKPPLLGIRSVIWREPLADNISVLDTGMSELVDSDDVKDMSIEQGSICDSEAARTPR